ncbi:MAG: prepilin-type N-terminal cleavage/methylation domain-containing protein [Candidatus Omnitrophota bacterium]
MDHEKKPASRQAGKAFTLIELIIVVVIIGILALIAIPKYFANVEKAKKNAVYASLGIIRQAVLSYYAVYGVYPPNYSWPIKVTVDGDTIVNVDNPSNAAWAYGHDTTASCLPSGACFAYKLPGNICFYSLCYSNGTAYGSCTP